jgi:hypothetical protein
MEKLSRAVYGEDPPSRRRRVPRCRVDARPMRRRISYNCTPFPLVVKAPRVGDDPALLPTLACSVTRGTASCPATMFEKQGPSTVQTPRFLAWIAGARGSLQTSRGPNRNPEAEGSVRA